MIRELSLASLTFLLAAAGPHKRPDSSKALAGARPDRAVLVELFTSEGCSSRPPADELLRRVDMTRTPEGSLIIGLSEHVTYWDHIGWKDPFGSAAATDRQAGYGERFALESVYTPQMVVNGEAQINGADAGALQHAVRAAETESAVTVKITAATLQAGHVLASVRVSGALPSHGAEVYSVIAEDETTQHVLRGENRGRTLGHASVARTLVKSGDLAGAGEITFQLPVANEAGPGLKRHLVVWVQEPHLGRVLGVGSQAF